MGKKMTKVLEFTRQGIFQRYETARRSRTRKLKESTGSADTVVAEAGPALWRQARHLDENHDLVHGILNILVNNTVGTTGIQVEPQVRNSEGKIAQEFVDDLMALYEKWSEKPEVTWEYDRGQMERHIARSMYRDGEVFVHHVGAVRGLEHGSAVPYSLELLESDYCPYQLPEHDDNVVSGVERNAWGRPVAYRIYKSHPGGMLLLNTDIKRVLKRNMEHVKLTTRLGQARGISVLAPVMGRLHDLKDYEESERIAARISAAQAFAIIRGSPDMYVPEDPDDPEADEEYRDFEVAPGSVWDDLLPGESVQDITPSRPSALLQPFRDSMMKAASTGASVSYSSANKDYSGTYSAQRQEQVEQYINYAALQKRFIGMYSVPVWQRFVSVAINTGLLRVPPGVDRSTLMDAEFRGPVMPWIDPAKEATANVTMIRAGIKSLSQTIRDRGENPSKVMAEIIREREFAEENGLQFSSFASGTGNENTSGDTDDEDDSEGQGLRTQGTGKD